MNIIDQIKERLELTDYARRYTELQHNGHNGRFLGLCPLHQEKTPSFFVFSQAQRWHCFGCNTGGDLFDLVQAREGLDFATALRELAREANVTLAEETPAQQAQREAEKERRAVLSTAVAHWQQLLHAPNCPGMDYALSRGFDAETIDAAGLGYHRDAAGLRAALQRAGVDVSHPAAKAVLATPPNRLIYPHYRRGNAVYFAARGITDKRHWNPPAELLGERCIYENFDYRPGSAYVIVVEGQGDAVALGALGAPVVALAGTSATKELLKTLRERHKTIYVGIENNDNDAGEKGARKIAAQLGALTRLVRWPGEKPGYDANDFLRDGATPERLDMLLRSAPRWLDILIAEAVDARPEDAEEATRAVFDALVYVDSFALTKLQHDVCDRMDLPRSTFMALLRTARLKAGLDQNGQPLYEVIGGQICLRQYGKYGEESITPLSNFACQIVADVVEDDGQTTKRYLSIRGNLADGSNLPKVEVPADEFAKMNWVIPQWGARAMLMAGSSTTQHLRAAIQTLSEDIEARHEYAHLGWRDIASERVYLSANGALGKPDVNVRLPNDLHAYRLPPRAPEDAALVDAVKASLDYLDIGEHHITIPLWAAVYLAPLASVLPPSFTLWLFGTTGSMKSTATALAMCHYGKFSYNLPAPASWTSDTTYALRVKSFLAKDAPLWVDDYAKQSTRVGENEMRKKAEMLLREWGNRSGRSAGQADGSLRNSHDPRGMVISTAEQLPPNPSIHPRLYAVEIHPGDITHGQGSKLTHAQQHDAKRYPQALAGYIDWLSPQLETLAETLPARRDTLTQKAGQQIQHLRSPMNVAIMYLGFEMGVTYAHSVGALDDDEMTGLLEYGWDVLLAVGEHQDEEVNREEDPVRMYFEALEQMLIQGTLYMRHRETPDLAETEKPQISKRQNNAAFVGWYDDNFWYLLDKPVFNAVCAFYRAGGTTYPDSARGIKVKFRERGLLQPDPSESYRHKVKIGGEYAWVLRLARSAEE